MNDLLFNVWIDGYYLLGGYLVLLSYIYFASYAV